MLDRGTLVEGVEWLDRGTFVKGVVWLDRGTLVEGVICMAISVGRTGKVFSNMFVWHNICMVLWCRCKVCVGQSSKIVWYFQISMTDGPMLRLSLQGTTHSWRREYLMYSHVFVLTLIEDEHG